MALEKGATDAGEDDDDEVHKLLKVYPLNTLSSPNSNNPNSIIIGNSIEGKASPPKDLKSTKTERKQVTGASSTSKGGSTDDHHASQNPARGIVYSHTHTSEQKHIPDDSDLSIVFSTDCR